MGLKRMSLKGIFIQYLFVIMVAVCLVIGGSIIALNTLVRVGIILPANHDEKIAFQLKEELKGKKQLTSEDFEGKCQYAIFDKSYRLISTNLTETDEALAYLQGEGSGGAYYVSIEGKNEWAVIPYQLLARYNIPFLERYLPNAELMHLGTTIVSLLVGIAFISSIYARRLKRALEPLEKAVTHIKEQNLDFELETTKIKEFDAISHSLNQMKEALQDSLTTQWAMETRKREQMAAIAHDIKTPLTIIKGNAQLLEEDETLDEEQRAFSRYIIKNSEQIQEYIKVLIEISTSESNKELHKQAVPIEKLMQNIFQQTKQLAEIKEVQVNLELPKEEIILEVDSNLMMRALLNIISNGIDYTPQGGEVNIKVEVCDGWLEIQVLDEGTGFSQKALDRACDMFYMGDESRTRKGHYGMGLHIAQQILVKHGGKLELENRLGCQGAKVRIRLPIKK